MDDTTLIAYGSELKAVEETETSWKFRGDLIVFDSPDISRERDKFTKATEFYFDDGEQRPVMYHHGLDPTIGKARIGTVRMFKSDAGVWVEGEIKKRTDYLSQHVERIAKGMTQRVAIKGLDLPVFGLSSGSATHMVDRVPDVGGHCIKAWAITEVSITPTPMEPLTSCVSLKSLIDADTESRAEIKRYDPNQPRDKNGQWGEGGSSSSSEGGHSVALRGSRVEAIANQYGVKSGSQAMAMLKDAHDRGYIGGSAALHNVLSQSAKSGHSNASITAAVNEYGKGTNTSGPYVSQTKQGKNELSHLDVKQLAGQLGHHPDSMFTGMLNEARSKGYIRSESTLRNVITESNINGFGSINALHDAINKRGDAHGSGKEFRSALLKGNRKSWDDVPLDERALEIKAYLTMEFIGDSFDETTGEDAPSAQFKALIDGEITPQELLQQADTDFVRACAALHGVTF